MKNHRQYCKMYCKERHRFGCSLLVLMLCMHVVLGQEDFTTSCPRPCDCKWSSGNKAANCSGGGLGSIPKNLSSDIQTLYLNSNSLYEITQNAFQKVGLSNLKKLSLKQCSLISVHKDAFSTLEIMIELDLSINNISTLHPDTFKYTEKIRWINLSNNRMEKLDDGLFKNMRYLNRVDLNNNKLVRLGIRTFTNVPNFRVLRLEGNNLTHMKLESVSSLQLTSLELCNNPWRCDCNLQAFRNWVIEKKLYTRPTSCAEPAQLHDKHWIDLNSSHFACKPSILYPTPGTVITASDDNVTLSCKVSGNPPPETNWVYNSRVIERDFRKYKDERYVINRSIKDLTKWVNLTIVNVNSHDRGAFTCVANNSGGLVEVSLTLAVLKSGPVNGAGTSDIDMHPILIGLTCGAAILLIIVIVLCYCFCRKRDTKRHIKTEVHSPNGDAMMEGSVIPEMEKSLITAVNPVTKPPRRYDAPPSVTSGATEMSELNRTLLDNDSVFAPNEDENRSLEFERALQRKPQLDNSEYGRMQARDAFPPDLLAFPPSQNTPAHATSRSQLSPAASCASTLPDNSRLPQHYPQSPLHSPIYGTNSNLFRTLPYSRSQSPFSTPTVCAPTVTPRQGYVTIPRRPRVPSWSSTASTVMTSVLPTSEAQEPLYDNLGLRTTADGSSVLSLNKAGLPEITPFNMRNRPLPATPTAFQSPAFYAPIEEHEPVPSPAPNTPRSTTSRNSLSSPNIHHQLSSVATSTPRPGPQEPTNRASWAKSPPEPAVRSHKSYNGVETGTLKKRDSIAEDQLKDTSVTFFPNGTLGRSGKIPPRPPPKPKKKTQTTDSNEPLFEDEGEDGTEV